MHLVCKYATLEGNSSLINYGMTKQWVPLPQANIWTVICDTGNFEGFVKLPIENVNTVLSKTEEKSNSSADAKNKSGNFW